MARGSSDDLRSQFAAVRFDESFRPYQRLALAAFDRAVEANDRRIYLTMPPGSGKTVVGLEIARRIGLPTMVLAPNTAIQSQWMNQWARFGPKLVPASTDPSMPSGITAITYQSIAILEQLEDGSTEEPGTPDALQRRRLRRAVMHGGDRAATLALLHDNGRAIIDRLAAAGPCTLILDECHHLLELWGHVLEAVVGELDTGSTIIGLTATPPGELGQRQAALYRGLFGGHADFEVVTPAVVKDGFLAPYQELALVTRPTDREARYIAAEQERFDTLRLDLLDPAFASVPFGAWFARRIIEPSTRDGVPVAWRTIEADHPDLARASIRRLLAMEASPPAGAHVREEHRQPPDAADWIALIEAYVQEAVRPSVDPRDRDALEQVRRALPAIGYILTTTGVRATRTVVDRVLSLSASKADATARILEAEAGALGADLRAVVLCDFESAGSDVGARLRHVLDPGAGGAASVLRTLVDDPRTHGLSPVLVTGRHVVASRSTAMDLLAFAALDPAYAEIVGTYQPSAAGGSDGRSGPAWEDLVDVAPPDPRWRPRIWVPLVTAFLEAGRTRCVVGTRGLLGEGWDCPPLNVLIDLGAATTDTSMHQVRGRSLRLDPSRPGKVADNWDVVCVAEEHVRGTADYERFVRKHDRYFALASTGDIESGVSHVDPALSPYGPPPRDAFESLREAMLERTRAREPVRSAWQIGEPYRDIPVETVRIRLGRSPGLPEHGTLRALERRRAASSRALPGLLGIAGIAGVLLVLSPWGIIAGLAGIAVLGSWIVRDITRSVTQAVDRLTPADTLGDIAAALADALVATELTRSHLGASAVRIVPQADGYYRCLLEGADTREATTFAVALEELISPLWDPRWIIPRRILEPPGSAIGTVGLLLRQRALSPSMPEVWHTVPAVLARRRERVAAFETAWRRRVSKGSRAIPVDDVKAQQVLSMRRGDDPFDVLTQVRTLWT